MRNRPQDSPRDRQLAINDRYERTLSDMLLNGEGWRNISRFALLRFRSRKGFVP